MLEDDFLAELVRQSFHLDWDGLVGEPELYARSASEKFHDGPDSWVEYREKGEVLAELESFVGEEPAGVVVELEHDENIAAWLRRFGSGCDRSRWGLL